ncbi:hypothetical protein SAMN00120144_2578 [Hymenobacter roseosalivarius DSM 11622]|uniref:Anti-sigma factor n=1 Tax=Hymenobacter roseosalivarius DSM 11622 TaxID=645990 RepID=A0A1W1VTC3_9BACT|nr:hypothetical protein [Hymenobacter roseosalivarius]SMB96523.1 hypothetical protein SAMN00120144_2578 [Hymenobacter roseosalivarius DSM 11622]
MNENKKTLEAFVEQHRADIDAFEPRPDLWDSIEEELTTPGVAFDETEEEVPLRVIKLAPEPVVSAKKGSWNGRFGIAAAIAVTVVAGGGLFWKNSAPQATSAWTSKSPTPYVTTAPTEEETNDSFYFGTNPVATAAANAPTQRLSMAVRQMEAYFASQIEERIGELRQLEEETATAPAADWQRELVALDSTYAQLKTELYRNPEPDMVLDAMNRNLQIRVDILNQQLRTRERIMEYHADQPEVAKNSRKR